MSKAAWISCATDPYGVAACACSVKRIWRTSNPTRQGEIPLKRHILFAPGYAYAHARPPVRTSRTVCPLLLLLAVLQDMRSCCESQHADISRAGSCNAHPAIQDPLEMAHHRRLACHLRGGSRHRGTILGRGLLHSNDTWDWHGRIRMCLQQQPPYFHAVAATACRSVAHRVHVSTINRLPCCREWRSHVLLSAALIA